MPDERGVLPPREQPAPNIRVGCRYPSGTQTLRFRPPAPEAFEWFSAGYAAPPLRPPKTAQLLDVAISPTI